MDKLSASVVKIETDLVPTIRTMELSTPKNWQEFETVVRDAQRQRLKSTSLQIIGRTGRKQDGVDISGQHEIGRLVIEAAADAHEYSQNPQK